VLFEREWVILAQISGGRRGRPATNFGVRVPGLSRGVVCVICVNSVILRLAVLILYRRVTQTDRRTDGRTNERTHDDGY